jgi:hypothetical protein
MTGRSVDGWPRSDRRVFQGLRPRRPWREDGPGAHAPSRHRFGEPGRRHPRGRPVVLPRCVDEGETLGICSVLRGSLGGGRPRRFRESPRSATTKLVGRTGLSSCARLSSRPLKGYSPFRLQGRSEGSSRRLRPSARPRPPACCHHGVTSRISEMDLRSRAIAYLGEQGTYRDGSSGATP